ncbi:T9SS type A sorting domain-containing protein [Chryseobacterium capnotolerans]|uniref:RCC1 domain-containing protein n=1 Tax=Chryseobacterium TaxID=59732 RepID=UPI00083B993E|nr:MULTISPECIES: T9SS type A sorting domain-containing protein [Chryseobacterium]UHO39641.1 T9SS type A sorting domain-containing protein [Chryseobacterium capnotolerans]
MKNYIYSIIALLMIILCPAQVFVSQAEYFWDTDPGTGNGTPVSAVDGSFNSVFEQLIKTDIATPGNGLHKFSVRIKDNTGVWGPAFTNVIDIQQPVTSNVISLSQAEYFWDTDPGAGNGTPVLAADGSFNSVFEQLIKTDIVTPGNGLHKFSVRIKDNTGVWGPAFSNVIDVQQPVTSNVISLSQAEYFWDTDPGEGSGTPVLAADGNFNSTYEELTKTGINLPSNGLHVFNIRIKDNTGGWGPAFKNVINIQTAASSGCWESLSAGNFHSVGLKSDGTLWAWGRNSNGQLGDGTTIDRNAPIQIGTDNNWLRIAAGDTYTLAIKTDGTLWAWGNNDYGQLGDGTKADKLSPTQIGTTAGWKSVSAGSYHSIGLKTDGTLWSWGYNIYGQLGDGTIVEKITPIQIGTAANWQSIAAGYQHNLAIKTDGTLWAWGSNYSGQLGDGTTTARNVPTQIGTAANWRNIDVGTSHSLGVKLDGTLWTWGANANGQLGNGSTIGKNIPTQIGIGNNWQSISASNNFSFANKTDGTLWSWGANEFGQLGNITSGSVLFPTQVGSSSDNILMSSGIYYTLVKNIDGVLKVCGDNSYGQLGDGTNNPKSTFVSLSCPLNCLPPAQFSTTNITSATATINWTGSNPTPNAGYYYLYSTSPFIGGIQGTTSSKTANLTNLLPNTVYYWWVSSNCGSSQGDWVSGGSFTTLTTAATGCWETVSTGSFHVLGIKTDGTLWAWGENLAAQLGDGTTVSKNTPTQIGTDNNWLKVSAGDSHTAAIKTDGTLWTWGDNQQGQLGNGTTVKRIVPEQIGTETNWVSISSADLSTFGIKSDGTLWGWGYNGSGQLGDGTTIRKTVPVQIGTANDWKMVTAGDSHILAIKTNGTLWGWGSNAYGRLGDGNSSVTSTVVSIPTQIGTAADWKSVSAGYYHSIGLKTDGTLWAWGDNFEGQLGDGTKTLRSIPIQIGTATDWKSVAANHFNSSVGIKTNGTLWAWGRNTLGQLGDGTRADRLVPSQIGTVTDRKIVSAGPYTTVAINNNGFLSATGSNEYGQLGDGTNIPKPIFVPVACPTSNLAVAEVSAKEDKLKVYPNPVQDILTISYDQKILFVTVYNASGQLILTKAINDTKGTIDASGFVSGVYLVKINAINDFVKTVKVIKR